MQLGCVTGVNVNVDLNSDCHGVSGVTGVTAVNANVDLYRDCHGVTGVNANVDRYRDWGCDWCERQHQPL